MKVKVEINLPHIQVDLENLTKIIPNLSHLEKLKNIRPLNPNVNRRIIYPEIEDNIIKGYVVNDFDEIGYAGRNYFTIQQLDLIS